MQDKTPSIRGATTTRSTGPGGPSLPTLSMSASAEAAPAAGVEVPIEWQVGDVILGLYEIRQVHTGGGLGLVYRAFHRGWKVELAVKSPRQVFFRTERHRESFIRECESWINLGLHPNVICCYYVRVLGGIPRIFAEYVDGGSLSEWIARRRLYAGGPQRALERILDVAIQFAWGLHYAHEQGLIHQDVKPGNVMVTSAGVPKVTDFGMARAKAAVLRDLPGDGLGSVSVSTGGMTPAYCSPEQAAGDQVTRKTDIWSWALSVLEMFAGKPFWARSAQGPAGPEASRWLEEYLAADAADAELPRMLPALVDLLRWCFRRKPEDRPRDMPQVAAELQDVYRALTGETYPRPMPRSADILSDSLSNRAVSLLDLGNQAEAQRLWEQAIQNEPLHPEAACNLGLLRWRQGRTTDQVLLRKIDEVVSSGQTVAASVVAGIHMERGDMESAIAILERSGEFKAQDEEILGALAGARASLPQSRRLLWTAPAHTGATCSVQLSRDGRYALSAGSDGLIRLWDLSAGRGLRALSGHEGAVHSASLSDDGEYALSGGADGTVRLWNLVTSQCLRICRGHEGAVAAVALAPDRRYALSAASRAGADEVIVWHLATGQSLVIFQAAGAAIRCVRLLPDARSALAAGGDAMIRVLDVAGLGCLRTFSGHRGPVHALALTPDGRRALSASEDATMRLWDVAGGRCLSVLEGHEGPVTAAGLDQDGRYAVSVGADRTIRLWQTQPPRCLWTAPLGEGLSPTSASMTPDGRLALVGGSDGSLGLWNVQSALAGPAAPMRLCRPRASQAVLFADSAFGLALSRGEEALARGEAALAARAIRAARCLPGRSRSQQAMDRWFGLYRRLPRKGLSSAWEQACLAGHSDGVNWACLHRDALRALTASQDGTLCLWEVPSASRLRTLHGHTDGVACACLGEQVALSGSLDGTLKLWNLTGGECLRTFHGGGRGVFCVCLFEPGGYALSGGADGAVRLWNLATGQCLTALQGHVGNIYSLCLSADGRHALSGASDGTMRLWNLATGRCTRVLSETAEVTCVAMSADRRYALCGVAADAASGAESGQTVLNLWDLAKGKRLRSFWGHIGRINSACFLSDGTFAISGAADQSVRLWHLVKGWCVRTIQGHTGSVTSVDVAGDGRYAISASSDHTARLWTLDWELEERSADGWSESARPVLETFLSCCTPFLGTLPREGLAAPEDVVRALTRRGRPTWSEADFGRLLQWLGQAGLGWIDPHSVRRELETMAAACSSPPRSPLDV